MIVFNKFMEDGDFTLSTMKCSSIALIARFRRDPSALLIVVLAGLGTAHILARTATYGAAVLADSTTYLSTALNFLAGEGWRDFTGFPLVAWPPLFSLLLAAGGWVGIDPLEVGRWVNAIAFGLTILAAGLYLSSNLRARGLALAAAGALAASLPLSELAASLMSEALFVLFTLLALMQLASFLPRGGRTPLLRAAVCTALAALLRYPGVVLIGVGVLLLLVRRTPPLITRLQHAVVFGAVSSLPLAVVLTRNWAVSGRPVGKRSGSGHSLFESLSQAVEIFRKWVIPPNEPDGFSYLLWTTAGLVVIVGMVVVVSGRGMGREGQRGTDRTAPPLFGLEPALPFGGFALGYFGFIVVLVRLVLYHEIADRHLLPVYVPLLVAAVLLLDRFLSIETPGRMAVAKWGLTALVLLAALAHTGFSARENLRLTARAYVAGFLHKSYNVAYWQHSPTLKYIKTNSIDGRIYTNHKPIAWFWDRTAAPGKYKRIESRRKSSAGLPPLAQDMRRWTKKGTGAHIVWFWDFSSQGYKVLDIRLLPGMETVAELSDGVVFRVTAAEPFNADRHRARKQRYVEQLLEQAGERVVRSDVDVYLGEGKLTYLKSPCAPEDVQAKFVLHVTPADPADLPVYRQRYGFNNLDFYFDQRGVRRGDQCMVIVHLPDYPIGRIRVGQWISNENRTLWDAEFAGTGDWDATP